MPRASMQPSSVSKQPEHDDAELLTLAAAAEYLNVDLRYLLRLVDEGAVIASSRGGEQVIPRPAIVAYRRQRDAERRAHLEEVTRLSEEAGMDDVDYATIIARTP